MSVKIPMIYEAKISVSFVMKLYWKEPWRFFCDFNDMTKLKPVCRSTNEIVHAVNFVWGKQYRCWEVEKWEEFICLLNWSQCSGTQYGNTPKLILPMLQSRLGFFPFCITHFKVLTFYFAIFIDLARHDTVFKILSVF